MDMGNETVDNRLTDFLNEGKNWERKQTNVPVLRNKPKVVLTLYYET